MKIVAILALTFTLSGCASTYKFSKDGLSYRSSLNESQALEVIRSNLGKRSEQEGVCSAHTFAQFVETASPRLDGANLVFVSYYTESKGIYSAPGGLRGSITVHSVQGETREGKWKVALKNVNKIRVIDEINGYGCHKATQGHILMIGEAGVGEYPSKDGTPAKAAAIMINISSRNLDRFVAALSYLAPNASLLHGVGL